MSEEPIKPTNLPQEQYFKIPDCCREGWDSCKHVVPKPKKIKRNIAL